VSKFEKLPAKPQGRLFASQLTQVLVGRKGGAVDSIVFVMEPFLRDRTEWSMARPCAMYYPTISIRPHIAGALMPRPRFTDMRHINNTDLRSVCVQPIRRLVRGSETQSPGARPGDCD
jgi:hypothetical protein